MDEAAAVAEEVGQREHPRKESNFVLGLTYKMVAQQMKQELSRTNYKHWSEDISINKMEKVSAILINYMPGLLLPAYSIVFDNRTGLFSEKMGVLLYYCLLGVILMFPFIYISGIAKRKNKKKGSVLKSSDI